MVHFTIKIEIVVKLEPYQSELVRAILEA